MHHSNYSQRQFLVNKEHLDWSILMVARKYHISENMFTGSDEDGQLNICLACKIESQCLVNPLKFTWKMVILNQVHDITISSGKLFGTKLHKLHVIWNMTTNLQVLWQCLWDSKSVTTRNKSSWKKFETKSEQKGLMA